MRASLRGTAKMDIGPTYDPRSSESAISSVPSILNFHRSKTSLPSATAGAAPPSSEPDAIRVMRRLGASLTLKLLALVGVFIALPIVLYGQFESAAAQRRELVARGKIGRASVRERVCQYVWI